MLTVVVPVALALAWVPPVLRAVAVMVRDTARTELARTVSDAVRCWPAGMSPELQHTVRPDRDEPAGVVVMTMLTGSRTQVRTSFAMAVVVDARFAVRTPSSIA